MITLPTWRLPRLSREWVGPITVTADGEAVTDWTYKIVVFSTEPAEPEDIDGAPTVLDGARGILVGPGTANALTRGRYLIWVRYVDEPEAPVLDTVGVLVIT